jgi:pyrroline-5-carboxylate reductase
MPFYREVGFVGAGAMTERIVERLVSSGGIDATSIWVTDISAPRIEHMRAKYGVHAVSPHELAMHTSVIVLAVRPQDVSVALLPYRDFDGALFSIVAGIKTTQLKLAFERPVGVTRIMPNVLGETGHGYSAICANETSSQEDIELVELIFGTLGPTIRIEESMLDAFTAFSTAGPALIMHCISGLIDSGVQSGFGRDLARRIVLENVQGSALVLQRADQHPLSFVDTMTSPSGVTIEAVKILNSSGLTGTLMAAVDAAFSRAKSLSVSSVNAELNAQ